MMDSSLLDEAILCAVKNGIDLKDYKIIESVNAFLMLSLKNKVLYDDEGAYYYNHLLEKKQRLWLYSSKNSSGRVI